MAHKVIESGTIVRVTEYGYTRYEGGTEEERRALPWYHPYAIPRFEGSKTRCRDGNCPDTNWGGTDRVHSRGPECPPFKGRPERWEVFRSEAGRGWIAKRAGDWEKDPRTRALGTWREAFDYALDMAAETR